MNTSSGSFGNSIFIIIIIISCIFSMQEEPLEKISSQKGNGKCLAPDGGDLCRKFSLHVNALIITRQ